MQKPLPPHLHDLIPAQDSKESDLVYGRRLLRLYRDYREFEGNGVPHEANLFAAVKILAENFRDTFGVFLGELEMMSETRLRAAREQKIAERRTYFAARGSLKPGCIP